jgi:hypothetical protein
MRSERHSSASATVVKANGRNQEWPKCPVRRLPYAELDNLYTYVPPRIAVRNVRRFGDLISYQNDGKDSTAIAGKVENA